MFKKLLAILLTCLMLLPCGVAMAGEAETHSSGAYKYTISGDGSATITDYTGKAKALTIPSELDGHPVTAIGYGAFVDCDSLTSITLPDGLTSIGDRAFASCASLTSITLLDSISSIGENPFANCKKLTQITVSPDNPTLATIDGVLFEKPTRTLICYPCAFTAGSYAVPQGIQAIGDSAFFDCDALATITLPDSVTTIGDSAFYDCESLASITLPDSVTSIGERAFSWCTSLTTITLPDSVTSIGGGAFLSCKSLTTITLPDSVTSIGKYAFAECPKLTLTVPRDSYALAYAKENGIPYTYTDSMDWLNG